MSFTHANAHIVDRKQPLEERLVVLLGKVGQEFGQSEMINDTAARARVGYPVRRNSR